MSKRILNCCRGGNRRGISWYDDAAAAGVHFACAHRYATAHAVGPRAASHTAYGGFGHDAAARGQKAAYSAALNRVGIHSTPEDSRPRPPWPPLQHRHRFRGRVAGNRAQVHTQRHGAPATHRPQEPVWWTQEADPGHERQGARPQGGDPPRGGRALSQAARGGDRAGVPQKTAKQTCHQVEKTTYNALGALSAVLSAGGHEMVIVLCRERNLNLLDVTLMDW